MGTTAYARKGSKGRAANGDWPVGAAGCRQEQYAMASCQPPPPSSPTKRGADGPGTDPWCDPKPPPPPLPGKPPPRGTRAYTYRHGGISLSSAP